jgi:hypothetical protein
MYSQQVTVVFNDGTEQEIALTQWSIGQFAQYAQTKGWHVDHRDPGLLSIVMLRFQAYAELHRDPTKPRPTFEKWDYTVSEVSPVQTEEGESADSDVDPTQTGASDS